MNELVCSNGGMVLTRENRSTWRKTCLSATLSTTNRTWTGLGLNPGLRSERPATGRYLFSVPSMMVYVGSGGGGCREITIHYPRH
jgi:hypothetical protein